MGISMDISMDIPIDIHEKIYGYGCGWEISYPQQACILDKKAVLAEPRDAACCKFRYTSNFTTAPRVLFYCHSTAFLLVFVCRLS